MKTYCFLLTLFSVIAHVGLAQSMRFEAEDGELTGISVDTLRQKFSGTGYVTGFLEDGDALTVSMDVNEGGLYSVWITYACTDGPKNNYVYVNDDGLGSKFFPGNASFTELPLGIFLLRTGTNSIRIEKDWGHFDVDFFTVTKAQPAETKPIQRKLVTMNPSNEAAQLMSWLVNMSGRKIISGQQGGNDEIEYIEDQSGQKPAIRGFDLLNYSLAVNWDDGATENIIEWFNGDGGIPTVCWHWFSPSGAKGEKSFYKYQTDFNVAAALESNTPENKLLLNDIDAIAAQLKVVRDAGVPVLWRPLHEAPGQAFWWSADGPDTYVKLYRLLFDRLTRHHQLNNLVWVWTTSDDVEVTNWYPGSEYVDIIGADIYLKGIDPRLSSSIYHNLAATYEGKLIALSENATIPDPGKLSAERATWSWFCTWEGEFLTEQNPGDHIKKVYNDEFVITLSELPDFSGKEKVKNSSRLFNTTGLVISAALVAMMALAIRTYKRRRN